MTEKIHAIKHILATIFAAQNALRSLAPEFKWSGLGNLLGDYGEYSAINNYGLIKAPSNCKDFDATTKEGKSVQIKSFNTGTNIKFKASEVDLLLVIKINDDSTVETIYFDAFEKIKPYAKFSAYSRRYQISISKLKELAKSK